jgi:(p)ppGpp synthase/HD superfamily hydrolase
MSGNNKSGFSTRFDEALRYASDIHRAQVRKATETLGEPAVTIPYIGHLIGAASIVIDAGGDEDEAIAALLHDAAEDQGGEARLVDIAERFGPIVATIVEGCSDSLVQDPQNKEEWRERKERYIAHLRGMQNKSIYLVSAADKCHNARATARDLAFAMDSQLVWKKFNKAAGPSGIVWYYGALIDVYKQGPTDPRRDLIVSDLIIAFKEISSFAGIPTLESLDHDAKIRR